MAGSGRQGVYRGEGFKAYIIMDSIEKALLYFETGERPTLIDNNEPTEVYDLIDKLKKQSSKYALDWWVATTEFRRSKLMRSNHLPQSKDEQGSVINVNYGNPSNGGIQENIPKE